MIYKPKGSEHKSYNTTWKKWTKYFSHRKNRQTTRRKLHHEEYDQIPKNKEVDTEDPWGWD